MSKKYQLFKYAVLPAVVSRIATKLLFYVSICSYYQGSITMYRTSVSTNQRISYTVVTFLLPLPFSAESRFVYPTCTSLLSSGCVRSSSSLQTLITSFVSVKEKRTANSNTWMAASTISFTLLTYEDSNVRWDFCKSQIYSSTVSLLFFNSLADQHLRQFSINFV